MAIIANRTTTYYQDWKGIQYGKTSAHDQITNCSGEAGLKNRTAGSANILRPAQQTRFYPGTTVCHSGPSTVFPDRLSRDCKPVSGILSVTEQPWIKQDTALHDLTEGPSADVKKNIFQGLLGSVFRQAEECGLIKRSSAHTCCIDSTGLENHYVSRHFLKRQGRRTRKYRRWTKLIVVCDNKSYLIASALISKGPSTDCHWLEASVEGALEHISITTLLADSGFDAEYNHELCRDKFKIRSTVIKVNDRNLKYSRTKGFFRRKMKERFPAKKYRQRWQIEAVFSRFKRRLGTALTARTDSSRTAECLLRVLTYNLMVVLFTFQKSNFTNLFYKAI